MRRLACCRRNREISLDFDEHDRVRTYSGLESCILNATYTGDNDSGSTSRADGGGSSSITTATDSPGLDGGSSCSPSRDDVFGSSFSSQWLLQGSNSKHDDEQKHQGLDEAWEAEKSPYWWQQQQQQRPYMKEKVPIYTMRFADVETMKEKFAKLLLGEDVSGGCRGVCTAVALSNAITNLAVSIFGELWKLEPLPEDKKNRWRREMDWLLSPTNYMVELVPAKQSGANGRMLEIMTPKARSDVHMNLPALQKLDSMLIDVLDSMVGTEFWYVEGGSRAEGRGKNSGIRQSKRWWLPSPRVPESGLSPSERKKLGFQGKVVHQVLKAAKTINEHILLQIPVPTFIGDALSKSGKASLGEDFYQALASESNSVEEIMYSLNLKSEHSVLNIVNCLDGAIFSWKERLSNGLNRRSPVRNSWALMWDVSSELDRIEVSVERAEALLRLLKTRFPNLPRTFLDVTKVQYNKDVGYSIIEAYSRVLGNLAFSILSRIGDILQEDDLNKPSTPVATLKFDFSSDVYLAGITETPPGHIKRLLIDQMDMVDGRVCSTNAVKASQDLFPDDKANVVEHGAMIGEVV